MANKFMGTTRQARICSHTPDLGAMNLKISKVKPRLVVDLAFRYSKARRRLPSRGRSRTIRHQFRTVAWLEWAV